MYTSREPSLLYIIPGVSAPIQYRFIGFGTKRCVLLYIVMGQNPNLLTGTRGGTEISAQGQTQ